MKLVNTVWILGAVAAFGMGAAAEGCSSSSQGNGTGTGDADCVALEACCATLSGSNAMMCMNTFNMGVDSTCAAYLTEIKASNLCTGMSLPPTGTDSGTGGNTPDTGTVTTGMDSGTAGSPDTGTTTGGMDAGTGGGADCEAPPAKVYAETTAGVYCPFSAVDGGKNQVCSAGEHCCEPATGNSTCEPAATACAAMTTDWQCEGTPDCSGTAGTVCCGTGTIATQAACGSYPAYPYISKFTGSSCAASCSTYQICSQTSECPSGKTCVPIKPKGNIIGICQ